MRHHLISFFCVVCIYLSCLSAVSAQQQSNITSDNEESPAVRLLVNIPARWIRLYRGDTCIAAYPVAVGRASTPTPAGNFKVTEKIINPAWTDPSDPDITIPSGYDNPLGFRWIGIGGNYGIHGTNQPGSIGKFISNGCIRVNEQNVESLFPKVDIGTPVHIVYNRLVVEKAPDGNIVYYIYPDAYYKQPLTTSDVYMQLEKFGVETFVDEASIKKNIRLSNGEPNYIGSLINLQLENQPLDITVIRTIDNIYYIPAYALSETIGLPVFWDQDTQMISSKYGSAAGSVKKDIVYINVVDIEKVFNLQRDWQRPDFLILHVMNGSDISAYTAAGRTAPKNTDHTKQSQ